MKPKFTGKYTRAFLTDKKMKEESIEYDYYNNQIDLKDNEAAYVFSFKGNKLVFAKGFEKIFKVQKNNLSILDLNTLFTDYFESFINEYHDRLLLYLYNNNENIETFASHTIIKVKPIPQPILLTTKVFKTDDNGNLLSVIGMNTFDPDLKTTDVIQYSLSGDIKPDFMDNINQNLDFKMCISHYNIKIIEELEMKKSSSEIATQLNISEEKLATILNNLLVKFELKDNQELIEFAKKNYLIPNQFDKYLNK